MVEFIKKAMNWVLEKEQEAADNCQIDIKDVEKQIGYMEEKRDKLKQDVAELEHILNRLHTIKAHALKCQTK
jgi:septal ring factor EnvC (AmiA/AmiB activator)